MSRLRRVSFPRGTISGHFLPAFATEAWSPYMLTQALMLLEQVRAPMPLRLVLVLLVPHAQPSRRLLSLDAPLYLLQFLP